MLAFRSISRRTGVEQEGTRAKNNEIGTRGKTEQGLNESESLLLSMKRHSAGHVYVVYYILPKRERLKNSC